MATARRATRKRALHRQRGRRAVRERGRLAVALAPGGRTDARAARPLAALAATAPSAWWSASSRAPAASGRDDRPPPPRRASAASALPASSPATRRDLHAHRPALGGARWSQQRNHCAAARAAGAGCWVPGTAFNGNARDLNTASAGEYAPLCNHPPRPSPATARSGPLEADSGPIVSRFGPELPLLWPIAGPAPLRQVAAPPSLLSSAGGGPPFWAPAGPDRAPFRPFPGPEGPHTARAGAGAREARAGEMRSASTQRAAGARRGAARRGAARRGRGVCVAGREAKGDAD
eukprot:scaffold2090_cov225-Prasinococcus_capsulatus_cf.AAC.21